MIKQKWEKEIEAILEQTGTVSSRPSDISSIPPKYHSWRPHQREAVEWVLEQWEKRTKCVVLDAPTGSGKSLIAIAAARLAGLKTLYLCSTRQLQSQLAEDFGEAVILWGREHYPCLRFRGLTAADCTHREEAPCPKRDRCPYKEQKRHALASELAIANYAYFLNEANFVGSFSGWSLVVMDEGDLAEDELMKFVSLILTRRQLEECAIDPPKYKTKFESWLKWTESTLKKVEDYLAGLEALITEDELPLKLAKEIRRYKRLASKLRMFAQWVDKNWVAELGEERWEFKPVFVRRFGHLITKHSEKILAMSATMLSAEDWAWNLGMNESNLAFLRMPSYFPKENRPMMYLPVADFSRKSASEETMETMVRVVDSILDKHQNEKGLIHAVSYSVAKYVAEHSRHQNRLVTHENAETRSDILEQFIASRFPLILISPSFGRGIDLYGDRARFQVLVKIPFLDLGDKQTSKRRWSGKGGERWYLLETVRAIVQMAGRIVRSADDYGISYILDTRWPRFYQQMKKDFPPWFQEACRW